MAINYRGVIRKLMPRAIAMGILPTHYLSMCQASYGQAYSKTVFLSDWREFAGIEKKRDPLQSIPTKYRPPEAVVQRTEYEQRKKFNYEYKIKGYDLIQQKDVIDYITVASDNILSLREAEEEAQRLADKYKIEIEIAEMLINGITVWKE